MDDDPFIKRLADEAHVEPARAADELDRVVHNILTKLRDGKEAKVPGLGTFRSDTRAGFQFRPEVANGGAVRNSEANRRRS